MSTFGRHFRFDRIERFTDQDLEKYPWFVNMLREWRPAGDALLGVPAGQTLDQERRHLRLAIRDGEANFYRAGQSIARINFGRSRKLQAYIHRKYVEDNVSDQDYVTLASGSRCDLAEFDGWIKRANGHSGPEKEFVDRLVAHNSDVVDLEMGLPAYSPGMRKALRVDLVALEPAGSAWRIVFWEVKRVDDGRARRKGEALPEVVEQMRQYVDWLSDPARRELVAQAYRNTCQLLVKFRELAKRVNPEIGPLGPGIVAVAAADAPDLLVEERPRLLIDNEGKKSGSFSHNGHLQKLQTELQGIHVRLVSGPNDMLLERHS